MRHPKSVAVITALTVAAGAGWFASAPSGRAAEAAQVSAAQVSTASPVPFLYFQRSGEFRARTLIGIPVKTSNGQPAGTIRDFVISSDGQVVAIVVGLGGLLGIGERNVALPPSVLKLERETQGRRVAIVEATRAQLDSAPDYWSERTAIETLQDNASTLADRTARWASELVR